MTPPCTVADAAMVTDVAGAGAGVTEEAAAAGAEVTGAPATGAGVCEL